MSIPREGLGRQGRREADFYFLQKSLPQYTIESVEGGFRCKSITQSGINDEAVWEKFTDELRSFMGKDFQEIYHAVNLGHINFTIYAKYE